MTAGSGPVDATHGLTEWRQDRPPLTDEHLAEIRERTKQGNILDWPNVDRAVLLSEVDRLRHLLTQDRCCGHARCPGEPLCCCQEDVS